MIEGKQDKYEIGKTEIGEICMNDVTIIDLFWDRDESAIKMAEEKYHALCYSIARKILANGEDAEECVNDTWYAAWEYTPPQRSLGLAAYLEKITRGFGIYDVHFSAPFPGRFLILKRFNQFFSPCS